MNHCHVNDSNKPQCLVIHTNDKYYESKENRLINGQLAGQVQRYQCCCIIGPMRSNTMQQALDVVMLFHP